MGFLFAGLANCLLAREALKEGLCLVRKYLSLRRDYRQLRSMKLLEVVDG